MSGKAPSGTTGPTDAGPSLRVAIFLVTSQRGAAAAPWTQSWERRVSAAFLHAYLKAADGSPIIPREAEETKNLVSAFLLDKALSVLLVELEREDGRPEVPLLGIAAVIATFTWRRTGSSLPGALICGLFVTWYVVAGTATQAAF